MQRLSSQSVPLALPYVLHIKDLANDITIVTSINLVNKAMLCVLYWQLNKKLVCLYPTLEKSHLSLHSVIIAFHNVKTTFVTQTQTYFPKVY